MSLKNIKRKTIIIAATLATFATMAVPVVVSAAHGTSGACC